MRLFFLFPIVCLLFFCHAVNGQQPAITQHEQEFSYDPYPDAPARIVNELLLGISQGSGRLRVYTRFTMHAKLESRLEASPEGICAVVAIKDVDFSGDVIYRDFSLEKILLPNHASMQLSVLDAQGRELFDTLIREVSVPVNGGYLLRMQLPSRVQQLAVSVRLSQPHFYYSQDAFKRFRGWFNALEQYYASGARLQKAMDMLQELDYSRVESLILQEFTLCEAEDLYFGVRDASFHNWIQLERSDPDQLLAALGRVEKIILPMRKGFNLAIASIDSLYHAAGMQALNEEKPAAGYELFSRAVTYNPFHIPSQLALADLELKAGKKAAAVLRMAEVFSRMYPGGTVAEQANDLIGAILDEFFSHAAQLTWEHRYLDALKVLEPVGQYCRQVEGFRQCPEEYSFRMEASHRGMYRSFLTVAARARRGDNLAFAEMYINSALEYQQKNTDYLPSGAEAYEQLQMVLARFIEKGYQSMESANYAMAASHFHKAGQMCGLYPQLLCHQGLEGLYSEASRLHAAGVTASYQAGSSGLSAMIHKNYNREEVLASLSQADRHLITGDLQQAQNIFYGLQELLLNFKINGDTIVSSRIHNLALRISEKECELAQQEFQVLQQQMQAFRGDIRQAAAAARQGFLLIDRNAACPLQPENPQLLSSLAAAVDYFQWMDLANQKLKQANIQDYADFISAYQKAEALFESENLRQLEIDHVLLVNYVAETSNVALANALLIQMLQWPDTAPEDLSGLFEKLRLKGVKREDLRQAQQAAGVMLAKHSAGQQQLKQLLRSGGRWYRDLESSYRRSRP